MEPELVEPAAESTSEVEKLIQLLNEGRPISEYE